MVYPQAISLSGHDNQSLKVINPDYRIYFTTIRKNLTYYFRASLRCKSTTHDTKPTRESVTVSLRTTKRTTAMSNSKYLKDNLITLSGSFIDFKHMRSYLKELAKNELLRPNKDNIDWFYKGNLEVSQEATQEASTVNQHLFLQSYSDINKKALESDNVGLMGYLGDDLMQSQRDSSGSLSVCASLGNTSTASQNGMTISNLIESYISEKLTNNEWTDHTANSKSPSIRSLIRYFKEVNQDTRPITSLSRNDLLEVRTVLTESGLKLSTVNSRLRDIMSLFKYAEMNNFVNKSVAQKLTIKDKTKKTPKALTKETIESIVSFVKANPTGSTSNRGKRHKENTHYLPYIQWVVQLAAITGGRLNEILQLRKADIKQSINGFCYYIDINDHVEGNTIKNTASNRKVPLVDGAYGFDLEVFLKDVVNTCTDDESFIFRVTLADRLRLRALFSNLFKRYKVVNKEAPDNLTMHSLRHSMATLCLNNKMPESFAKEVLGHTQSITYGLYGSQGVDIEEMHKEMVLLFS